MLRRNNATICTFLKYTINEEAKNLSLRFQCIIDGVVNFLPAERHGWLRTPHFFSPVFAFRCKRYLAVKAIPLHSPVVHHNYVTRRSYKNGEDGSEMPFCRIH